jgi:TonB family protein
MMLVLAFTVGEDGKPRDISIVTPVGMGMDDDAAEIVSKWEFSPGIRQRRPCAVPARVAFDIRGF